MAIGVSSRSKDFESVRSAYQDPVHQLIDIVFEIQRERFSQWVVEAERAESPLRNLKERIQGEGELNAKLQQLAERKMQLEKENIQGQQNSSQSLEGINAQIKTTVLQIFGNEIFELEGQLAVNLAERHFKAIVNTAEGVLAVERVKHQKMVRPRVAKISPELFQELSEKHLSEQKRVAELNAEIEKFQRAQSQSRAVLEELQRDVVSKKSQETSLKTQLDSTERSIGKLTRDLAGKKEEMELQKKNGERELKQLEDQIKRQQEQLAVHYKTKQEKQALCLDREQLQREVGSLKVEKQKFEGEKKRLTTVVKTSKTQIAKLNEELEKQTAKEGTFREFKAFRSDLNQMKEVTERLKQECRKVAASKKRAEQELALQQERLEPTLQKSSRHAQTLRSLEFQDLERKIASEEGQIGRFRTMLAFAKERKEQLSKKYEETQQSYRMERETEFELKLKFLELRRQNMAAERELEELMEQKRAHMQTVVKTLEETKECLKLLASSKDAQIGTLENQLNR